MALSAFGDKSHRPTGEDLESCLGKAHAAWGRLIATVGERLPPISEEWGFTSAGTGWGLRLRHAGRVILYMTPGRGCFLASFALGEKAVAAARRSKLAKSVLTAIEAAPRYAEGRGVRIEVRRLREVPDLAELARIKNEN